MRAAALPAPPAAETAAAKPAADDEGEGEPAAEGEGAAEPEEEEALEAEEGEAGEEPVKPDPAKQIAKLTKQVCAPACLRVCQRRSGWVRPACAPALHAFWPDVEARGVGDAL